MIENLDKNQIIFIIVAMAVSAVPVGFMAGLFGIGGGLITVPVLFYIFNSVGLDKSFIMHLAVGTSFSIIIPTSIISTITHMKYKAVDFKIVKTIGLFVTPFSYSIKVSVKIKWYIDHTEVNCSRRFLNLPIVFGFNGNRNSNTNNNSNNNSNCNCNCHCNCNCN